MGFFNRFTDYFSKQKRRSTNDASISGGHRLVSGLNLRPRSEVPNHGFSDLDLPVLPVCPNGEDFIIKKVDVPVWGRHRPHRSIVEQYLSTQDSLGGFMETLVGSLELAKTILAVPDSLPIISIQYHLSAVDQQLLCALAVGVLLHHIEHLGEPSSLIVTDVVTRLLGIPSSDDPSMVTSKSWEILDRAAEKTRTEKTRLRTIKKKYPPENNEPVWMLDPRFPKERHLYFTEGIKKSEIQRAHFITLWGLSQREAGGVVSQEVSEVSNEEAAVIAEKMSRGRLLQAAGTFPTPDVWAEARI